MGILNSHQNRAGALRKPPMFTHVRIKVNEGYAALVPTIWLCRNQQSIEIINTWKKLCNITVFVFLTCKNNFGNYM